LKLFEIEIYPQSGFGTPLKGDTLFGHFCWQAAYSPDILNGGLDRWIASYDEKPFAVFSSAFPRLQNQYAIKKPDLPPSFFVPSKDSDCESFQDRIKEIKKKKWLLVDVPGENKKIKIKSLEEEKFLTNGEFLKKQREEVPASEELPRTSAVEELFIVSEIRTHNTISRLSQTTGTGRFAPFTMDNFYYYPGTRLSIFALIDEAAVSPEGLNKAFFAIGQYGYGKDASTGKGRFSVENIREVQIEPIPEANAMYMLSPALPETGSIDRDKSYFTPFTRFGKHGDRFASAGNPFKKPLIMADEGAVLTPSDKESFTKPYFGKAGKNVSKILESTRSQGYSIYLPLKLEAPA
jgi:CRISPR-associated protein Csm4